jgi:hypothetical protein
MSGSEARIAVKDPALGYRLHSSSTIRVILTAYYYCWYRSSWLRSNHIDGPEDKNAGRFRIGLEVHFQLGPYLLEDLIDRTTGAFGRPVRSSCNFCQTRSNRVLRPGPGKGIALILYSRSIPCS